MWFFKQATPFVKTRRIVTVMCFSYMLCDYNHMLSLLFLTDERMVVNGISNGYTEKHVKKEHKSDHKDKHRDKEKHKDRHKDHKDKEKHRDKEKQSSGGKVNKYM